MSLTSCTTTAFFGTPASKDGGNQAADSSTNHLSPWWRRPSQWCGLSFQWMDGCINGWQTHAWMDALMDGWMDGCMDGNTARTFSSQVNTPIWLLHRAICAQVVLDELCPGHAKGFCACSASVSTSFGFVLGISRS